MCVDTSSVDAGILLALVDVDGAIVSGESGRAGALVRVRQGRAGGAVLAGLQGAVVDRLAARAAESVLARTRVVIQRPQDAHSAVLTGRRVANVGHGDLAQRRREAQRTGAREAGHRVGRHFDGARSAVLATRSRTRVARIGELAILAHILRRTAATQTKR